MTTPAPPRQPTQRPAWLPDGHAICPGAWDKVVGRMQADLPGYFTTYYTCAHGEWLSQAEAWSDHELTFAELTPDTDQSATAIGRINYQALEAQTNQHDAEMAEYRTKVQSTVACPWCGMGKDWPCENSEGPTHYVHDDRSYAYAEHLAGRPLA